MSSIKIVLTRLFNRYSKLLLFCIVLLIIAGHIYNYFRFDLCSNGYEYGLYESKTINGEQMRWTWKRSFLCESAKTDLLGLTVYASPHNIEKKGFALDFFIDNKLLDRIHFVESGFKPLYYHVPDSKGKVIKVKTEASNTFNPYRLGLSESRWQNREQAIAVSPISYLRIVPKDGVGFYREWEEWNGDKIPGFREGALPKYRWTRMQASLNAEHEFSEGGILFLRCTHPNIKKNPVVVEIINDDALIRNKTFSDNEWKKVEIMAKEVEDSRMLTFRASRTWSPKLEGISDDCRELGVAVLVGQF